MEINVISFDLDGTIVDFNYNKALWDEAIPHLYSKRHKMPIRKAKKIVLTEYRKAGMDDIRWYLPSFWFKKFDIGSHSLIARDLKHHVKLYPDSIPALKLLSKRFRLIIISNSESEFVKIKLETEGIGKYFSKCYSSLDMFGDLKSPLVFKAVLKNLKIKKEEIVHVGDDPKFDYFVPRKLGINAFILHRGDRLKRYGNDAGSFKIPSNHIIKDLRGLVKKMDEMGT